MSEISLSWVQKLDKNKISEELRNRGDDAQESENFNDLRERLRSLVKKEIEESKSILSKSKTEDSSTQLAVDKSERGASGSTSESEIEDTSEISDNVKLEFRLGDSD